MRVSLRRIELPFQHARCRDPSVGKDGERVQILEDRESSIIWCRHVRWNSTVFIDAGHLFASLRQSPFSFEWQDLYLCYRILKLDNAGSSQSLLINHIWIPVRTQATDLYGESRLHSWPINQNRQVIDELDSSVNESIHILWTLCSIPSNQIEFSEDIRSPYLAAKDSVT